jgi:hypothetical protein
LLSQALALRLKLTIIRYNKTTTTKRQQPNEAIEMITTITTSNILMQAFDKGQDVQVLIRGISKTSTERWFSVHTHKQESFQAAATRAMKQIAGELNTKILAVLGGSN